MNIKIVNASVYCNGHFEKKDVYINEGKISFSPNENSEYEEVNASGKMLIPGFIDIHIHGAMGHDFNDGTCEAIDEIACFTAKHGTTSLLATTSTVSAETVKNAAKAVYEKMKHGTCGSEILGLHMEGPFFNKSALGAQNPEYVQLPSVEAVDNMLGEYSEVLKLIAVAPELENAIDFIKDMRKRGVRVAIGHTAADYNTAVEAIKAGADMMTHFYNAMTPLKHRDPGVVGAVFDYENADVQLICDLIHVHPAAIRVAVKNAGRENVIMISDAISGTGLGDGEYDLGGLAIFVKDGIARIKEGNLAGSTLTLDNAMKNMISIGFTVGDAVTFLSENPAIALGIDDKKGFIDEGYDADLVLMDDGFNVCRTFVNGKTVYCE